MPPVVRCQPGRDEHAQRGPPGGSALCARAAAGWVERRSLSLRPRRSVSVHTRANRHRPVDRRSADAIAARRFPIAHRRSDDEVVGRRPVTQLPTIATFRPVVRPTSSRPVAPRKPCRRRARGRQLPPKHPRPVSPSSRARVALQPHPRLGSVPPEREGLRWRTGAPWTPLRGDARCSRRRRAHRGGSPERDDARQPAYRGVDVTQRSTVSRSRRTGGRPHDRYP
jgi:hypothetical protein